MPKYLDYEGLKLYTEQIKSNLTTAEHEHDAGDITSGTLSIEQGGTGASEASAARENLGFQSFKTVHASTSGEDAVAFAKQTLTANASTSALMAYLSVNGAHWQMWGYFTGSGSSGYGGMFLHQYGGKLRKFSCLAGTWTEYHLPSIDEVYPVGAVYISYVSTSPASLFGGSWTAITGRFPYFNAGTSTGGSNNAIVVSHTHTASTSSAGSHQHAPQNGTWSAYAGGNANAPTWGTSSGSTGNMITAWAGDHTHTVTVNSTGSSGTNANMPAYQTLYAWRRTA